MSYENLTKEKLLQKKEELTALKNEYKNEEQAIKLTMNSIYGSIGNSYFVCFNHEVAEAVTLQGQDMIKYSEKIVNRYFHDFWHDDTELHEKLGLTQVKRVVKPLVIYSDTDSVESSCLIRTQNNQGEIKISTIEDFFLSFASLKEVVEDDRGNQIVSDPESSVLNYKHEALTFSRIKKIIRHEVTKPKWQVISASGKEIIVTNDHSVTIFRAEQKLHVKPSEIDLEIDRVLIFKTAEKMVGGFQFE
ncbi:hypothetical protein EBS02_12980, partial [bacterium]|nr:hypothetical protein [bacterium]